MTGDGTRGNDLPRFAIEEVATPGMLAFQRYWDDLRGDRFAPSWRDVHLDELDPKIVPYIVVADVQRAPLDFVIRFWGTQNALRKGVEKTGDFVSGIMKSRGAAAFAEYRWVVENRKPIASRDLVNLQEGGHFVPFEQSLVRFPLSDDGVDVHHVISICAWDQH